MNSDAPTQARRLDPTATRASIMLVAGIALLVAFIIYSAMADLGWLPWLLARGWLITLAVIIIALVALLLFDTTRLKNIVWRSLCRQFGEQFGEMTDPKTLGTGRGQVGDHMYTGLRSFGFPDGLKIGRILSFVNPPLYIPWSAITKIDVFPNLLTGRKDFETDMQAQIVLRDQPELTIEVPWLAEFRQLLPKSVKYRAIKLSKK